MDSILNVDYITDNLKKFWNSFETWHNKSDIVEELFKAEYMEYYIDYFRGIVFGLGGLP